ncbi:MAG: RNA-binding S4 domain-containing protein [Zoogloeaceae bacterium]|nr:RNA-binding S4 domain-containing protein [Zoogloeaceae bacterium]
MSTPEKTSLSALRLDKWLWAARFFKTRSLASQAIDGGKVKLNGHLAKPAKEVRQGDMLELSIGHSRWVIQILALNAYRRPAAEAQLMYSETAESRLQRQLASEERRMAPSPGADIKGRPTKRARRQLQNFSS